MIITENKISNEYIRGLVEGEGSFCFCTTGTTLDSTHFKTKIPAFILSMHHRDLELITKVKEKMGIKNKVYVYRLPALITVKKIYKRAPKAMLIVREIGNLKNIVVPFFYKRLYGYKGVQFKEWLNNIGSDPAVPKRFKILYQLHKCGYYDRNSKFIE